MELEDILSPKKQALVYAIKESARVYLYKCKATMAKSMHIGCRYIYVYALERRPLGWLTKIF